MTTHFVVCQSVNRFQLQDFLKMNEGFFILTEPFQKTSQIVMHSGAVGVELHRLEQVADRVLVLAFPGKDTGQVDVCPKIDWQET